MVNQWCFMQVQERVSFTLCVAVLPEFQEFMHPIGGDQITLGLHAHAKLNGTMGFSLGEQMPEAILTVTETELAKASLGLWSDPDLVARNRYMDALSDDDLATSELGHSLRCAHEFREFDQTVLFFFVVFLSSVCHRKVVFCLQFVNRFVPPSSSFTPQDKLFCARAPFHVCLRIVASWLIVAVVFLLSLCL